MVKAESQTNPPKKNSELHSACEKCETKGKNMTPCLQLVTVARHL